MRKSNIKDRPVIQPVVLDKKGNIRNRPVFQPVVLDEKGNIRNRFNTLYVKTRIEKRALASKIFDVGMKILEQSSEE